MPIYEFECLDCHRKTTALVLVRSRVGEVRCKKCGSANLEKLFSRFASPKSEDARLEAFADPSAMDGVDENDPRSVARFMKKMAGEMGEDLGEDIDEAIEDEAAGGGDDPGDEGTGGGAGL